jgi:hypothetical protein
MDWTVIQQELDGLPPEQSIIEPLCELMQDEALRVKAGTSQGLRPHSRAAVRSAVEVVRQLIDQDQIDAARSLYTTHLSEGGYGYNAFRELGAIEEGLACNLMFVGNATRRQRLEEAIGKVPVSAHCASVSLYHYYLGNLVQALDWRQISLNIRKQLQHTAIQAYDLREIAWYQTCMGCLQEARASAILAIGLSNNMENQRSAYAFKAYDEFLLGYVEQATQDFHTALSYERQRKPDERYLCAIEGHLQAECLIRMQDWDHFDRVNDWNIQQCQTHQWLASLDFCCLLQAWASIERNAYEHAQAGLQQINERLCDYGMVDRICRLDWVWGHLACAQGQTDKGLQHTNNALDIAVKKELRLWQADLLSLRARLLSQRGDQQQAKANIKAATTIAAETGYAWVT